VLTMSQAEADAIRSVLTEGQRESADQVQSIEEDENGLSALLPQDDDPRVAQSLALLLKSLSFDTNMSAVALLPIILGWVREDVPSVSAPITALHRVRLPANATPSLLPFQGLHSDCRHED